ncbi:MAG: hypothetical protein WCF44_01520 [Candidatus Methylophosphatis roskildensis]
MRLLAMPRCSAPIHADERAATASANSCVKQIDTSSLARRADLRQDCDALVAPTLESTGEKS